MGSQEERGALCASCFLAGCSEAALCCSTKFLCSKLPQNRVKLRQPTHFELCASCLPAGCCSEAALHCSLSAARQSLQTTQDDRSLSTLTLVLDGVNMGRA